MENLFATRMNKINESFIREILKITEKPEIISFAGGLPNPELFPIHEITNASNKVLKENGSEILQYSTTEGYRPLREYIAERYRQKAGLVVDPDDILITNGSQQGIDLVAKILIDRGDNVVIERPGYLGAIQALSFYEPKFHPVPMQDDGINIKLLRKTIKKNTVKMFYTVPNFQNPSGISYSGQKRREVAGLMKEFSITLVEDNPYGDLRFLGNDLPLMKSYLHHQGILLGSFSKIIVPGIRLGWVCACGKIMEKLIVAKQASDLHSNYLSQRIIHQYLMDNDLDIHIRKIKDAYKKQRNMMVSMIQTWLPEEIGYSKPEGGMFLWISLPPGISSLELFNIAIESEVAFVPGDAFYVDESGSNTLRLNFSNSNEAKIEEGIKRLAKAYEKLLATRTKTSA